jgi:hypothetical protein
MRRALKLAGLLAALLAPTAAIAQPTPNLGVITSPSLPYVDVRAYFTTANGAGCGDWGSGKDANGAVQDMLSAGIKAIYLPAHCTWTLPGNLLPAGVNVMGGDPETSIIAAQNETTDFVTMGQNSSVSHVGAVNVFCYSHTPPVGHKICPVIGTFWNTGNSTGPMNVWAPTSFAMRMFPYTDVNGITNTGGGNGFAIISASAGSGNFYSNSWGDYGIGYDTQMNGSGDFGINMNLGKDDPTLTHDHTGLVIKDYSAGSGGSNLVAAARIVRQATGSVISPSFRIDDNSTVGTNYTSDVFDIILGQQAAGSIFKIFQTGTTFTGNAISLNGSAGSGAFNGDFINIGAATGTGTFAGNYLRFLNAGALKYQINAIGINYTAYGTVIGAQPYLTNMPIIGSSFALENAKFSTVGDSVAKIMLQVAGTGSTAAAIRLLTDGSGTATGNNCGAILANNKTAVVHNLAFTATDITNPAKRYSYYMSSGQLARFSNTASTTFQGSATPENYTSGGITGQSTSITADTINACLNISWTPPTSNTDTWHVTGSFEMDTSQ